MGKENMFEFPLYKKKEIIPCEITFDDPDEKITAAEEKYNVLIDYVRGKIIIIGNKESDLQSVKLVILKVIEKHQERMTIDEDDDGGTHMD